MIESIKKTEYYRELYRLLGNDGGIESRLEKLAITASDALVNEAIAQSLTLKRDRPFTPQKTIAKLSPSQKL